MVVDALVRVSVCTVCGGHFIVSRVFVCLSRYYIGWSDEPLEIIEDIYGNAIPEMMGEEPKDQSSIYPTLTM